VSEYRGAFGSGQDQSAATLGMLPLAYGVGSGAQMLKPLAVAVMGALAISVLLSLVATPAVYYVLLNLFSDTGTLGEVGVAKELKSLC
jgi:AcrB/AcrD/AcrF family